MFKKEKDFKAWDESEREDLRHFKNLIERGFKPCYTTKDKTRGRTYYGGLLPMDSVSFMKADWRLWQTRNGWNFARIENGKFVDHYKKPLSSSEPLSLLEAAKKIESKTVKTLNHV